MRLAGEGAPKRASYEWRACLIASMDFGSARGSLVLLGGTGGAVAVTALEVSVGDNVQIVRSAELVEEG